MTRALDWAASRLGDPSYALRCLAFVEDAVERANAIEVFCASSAAEAAASYDLQPYDADRPPPAGSLVFYAARGPIGGRVDDWGHVGLARGDGSVIHAWDIVRVDDAAGIQNLHPAAGWSPPRLIGWAAAQQLLAGHRPRDWGPG